MPYTFENSQTNVAGEAYEKLMDFCFAYGQYFALTFLHIRQGIDPMDALEPYAFAAYRSQDELWYPYGQEATVRLYRCTPESKRILQKQADALDQWEGYSHHNPEDLTFFRDDGSTLFSLVTHESWTAIFDRPKEIVPDFVLQEWKTLKRVPDCAPVVWTAKYIGELTLSDGQKKFLRQVELLNREKRKNPYRKR
ncbi:MAG: hypothetical protein ACOYJY_04425 [Acutalibacteraceae bacterium]|jgi:hypothetical protein